MAQRKPGNGGFSKAKVAKAILGCGGLMTVIARKLDCEWHTAKKHINKWPETRQAFENERETFIDIAENVIIQSVKKGDTKDARWVLSTLGKNRGYSERQEITGADGGPLSTEVLPSDRIQEHLPKETFVKAYETLIAAGYMEAPTPAAKKKAAPKKAATKKTAPKKADPESTRPDTV